MTQRRSTLLDVSVVLVGAWTLSLRILPIPSQPTNSRIHNTVPALSVSLASIFKWPKLPTLVSLMMNGLKMSRCTNPFS
ncbi:hypothetical protein JAAARDRAFT_211399 [Jaapia argillacea MUCL 33604]|uniref:Uncharacterized protein n=1 Tax=Jaapia argillacea MUCL 33604 TaxID=933084 RepID=A0A067PAY1_9AGAM|nr:hypothetical protein JAAARDRAFT_211399 [Jaapia argillacea MUCL 33604]